MSEFSQVLENYFKLLRENNDRLYLLLNDMIRRGRRDEELLYTLIRQYYIESFNNVSNNESSTDSANVNVTPPLVSPVSNRSVNVGNIYEEIPSTTTFQIPSNDGSRYNVQYNYRNRNLSSSVTNTDNESPTETPNTEEMQHTEEGPITPNQSPIVTYDIDIQIEDERHILPGLIHSPSHHMISRAVSQQRRQYSRPISRLYGIYSEVLDNVNVDELESVPIIPTQEQVDGATEIIRFGDIQEPQNNLCSISLREFSEDTHVSIIKYCGHIFSPLSLTQHFTFDVRCPLCRYDIRNYTGRDFDENEN